MIRQEIVRRIVRQMMQRLVAVHMTQRIRMVIQRVAGLVTVVREEIRSIMVLQMRPDIRSIQRVIGQIRSRTIISSVILKERILMVR